MRETSRRLLGALFCATLPFATANAADSKLTGPLKVEQTIRANLMPFSPTYVTSKCLIPYPICKLAYSIVAFIAGAEQLIVGADVKGAAATLGRGMDGPWLIRPENVTGEPLWSLPPPVPLVAYFATGRNNSEVPIDPMPAAKRAEEESGDVLPP
jgi:hypothetical protein